MNSEDAALSSRAAAVMPWRDGRYGHMSTALLPSGYPQFYERGQGGRVWDVNGNSYVDLMCSWGTIALGHHHPAVEAAANQQALGDCLNGPGRPMVELAELLTETIGHADGIDNGRARANQRTCPDNGGRHMMDGKDGGRPMLDGRDGSHVMRHTLCRSSEFWRSRCRTRDRAPQLHSLSGWWSPLLMPQRG